MDAKAFTAFEQAAHDRIAQTYAEHFSPLTSLALDPCSKPPELQRGGGCSMWRRDLAWLLLRRTPVELR